MSANYRDLLKYAATGIASPSMTYYDRMRASTLMGGAVQTLTGQPPLSFKSNGTPLISWSMKGNGSQQGTPTPDAPIQPTFCGVRTGNLYNIDAKNTANGYIDSTQLNQDGTTETWTLCEVTEYIEVTPSTEYVLSRIGSLNAPSYCIYDTDKQYISGGKYGGQTVKHISVPSNGKYIRFSHYKTSLQTMLNLGSTALPYEPFGYKIPITCAGQTVPVYLGQTQTVRRIKKLVLDGTENWYINDGASTEDTVYLYTTGLASNAYVAGYSICSHFEYKNAYAIRDENGFQLLSGYGGLRFRIMRTIAGTVADFKAWLASEYAAGHPVEVWYVLANSQTGIVNEPLAKIGDYADELHSTDATVTIPTAKGQNTLTVDTTVQPSEVSIKGNIKPTT